MIDSIDPQDPPDGDRDGDLEEDIEKVNLLLSDWAARSAAESDGLIERFERMGYEVRGKSEEEIAHILRRPPTRSPDQR